MHGDKQPRLRSLVLPAFLLLAVIGCSHSPLAIRTSAFATAATVTATNTGDAYTLVEQTFREAQTARMVEHFNDSGFDPTQIKPFLPEEDRKVRTDVIDGLRSYAELLAAVSGDQPANDVDTSAKAMAASLQGISSNTLLKANLTTTGAASLTPANANLFATAIDALGKVLLERRRRRELPSILREMQQPIETICNLLAADIGDPERSGLRNQLHNSYLNLLREQTNYIAENTAKLSPSERRAEIRVLPKLADSAADGDHALAETQKALFELARTHTALAASAGQKDAPAFRLQLKELDASARRLTVFYSSLPPHH